MIRNIKLNVILSIAFGSILMLLVIKAVIAYNGLQNGYTSFKEYRGLATDSNLAGLVQSNMLSMRMSVLKFINNNNQASVDEFDTRQSMMNDFLAQAKVEIQKPSRAALVSEVDAVVGVYGDSFKKVVDLFGQRSCNNIYCWLDSMQLGI